MADKEKKKKKKVAKDDAPADAPAPEPAEAAPPPEPEKKPSSKGSKKAAKRAGSSVFSMFSQKQVSEFKEGFQLMDADKDGILGKNDLRATFDMLGRLVTEKELDDMLGDAPGPINFTMLISMFAERMSGGSDEDDVVVAAFKTFDENGKIDTEKFRKVLMTFGDKFTSQEVDDCFEQFPIDDSNMVDTQAIISMLTASPAQEEEGEGENAS